VDINELASILNDDLMILNDELILRMTASDFEEYKFWKLKVVTKEEIEINGKKGKEFIGFIAGLNLAVNPPNLVGSIRFIDESVSPKIFRNISSELGKSINVFKIESIELINA